MILIFILSCSKDPGSNRSRVFPRVVEHDTIYIHDTIYLKDTLLVLQDDSWQKGFGLTHDPDRDTIAGMEARYYLSHPDVSPLAFDFYYGNFRPGDNASTYELVQLVLNEPAELRPFYLWVLDKVIMISDGALGEYPGEPARKFAQKYPSEFMKYMRQDSLRLEDWTSIIRYSGLTSFTDSTSIVKAVSASMTRNCPDCSAQDLQWIQEFAQSLALKEEY